MSGRLLGADLTRLQWQSDTFPHPFTLETERLSWVKFAGPGSGQPSELPYRAITLTNDVLFGALEDITEDHVVLRSPRHGQVRLLRRALLGLQRNDSGATISVGLEGLKDWKTLHRGRNIEEWTTSADGHITTSVMGAELFRDFQMGSVSEIEIALRWDDKPGFLISFAGPEALRLPKEVVKLETWDNDLVLQTLGSNGDFEVIHALADEAQSIELRLQWNPRGGELAVFTMDGQLLGKLQGGDVGPRFQSGFYLQNKGTDLSLVRLRINNLGGVGVEPRAQGITHLRLDNNKTISGTLAGLDRAKGQLELELTSGGRRRVPLGSVASVDFGSPERPVENEPQVQVGFFDGTQLSGTLMSIRESRLELQVGYTRQPVTSDLAGVSRIRFAKRGPPPSDDGLDVLTLGGNRWRGHLTAAPTLDSAVGWQPVGAASASAFPAGQSVNVVRDPVGRGETVRIDGPPRSRLSPQRRHGSVPDSRHRRSERPREYSPRGCQANR